MPLKYRLLEDDAKWSFRSSIRNIILERESLQSFTVIFLIDRYNIVALQIKYYSGVGCGQYLSFYSVTRGGGQ